MIQIKINDFDQKSRIKIRSNSICQFPGLINEENDPNMIFFDKVNKLVV